MSRNKQLVCKGAGCLELKQGEIPDVPQYGIVIQVSFCGICHSDAKIYGDGPWDSRLLPKILGHEISGIVHLKGNVSEVTVGSTVLVFPFGGCRKCDYCKAGCVDCIYKDQPIAHSYGIWKDGGYQQYLAVHDMWCVVPLPESVPMDLGCTVGCSGVTAYNAVEHCKDTIGKAIDIKGKANIAVIGIGAVGIWAIQILKAMYGSNIYICAIDIKDYKLKDAITHGADITCCWQKEGNANKISNDVRQVLNGDVVDAVIDCVAIKSTIDRIFPVLSVRSTLLLVGLYESVVPSLSTIDFTIKSIKLQGVYCGSRKQLLQVLDLVASKQIKGPAITHVSLEDVQGILTSMVKDEFQSEKAVVKMA